MFDITRSHSERFSIVSLISCIGLCLASALNIYPEYITIALYGIIPFCFCCSFFQSNNRRLPKELKQLLYLYMWIIVCIPFAEYPQDSTPEIPRIIGCFLVSYTICLLSNRKSSILFLYLIPICYLLTMWLYAYSHLFASVVMGEGRLSDETISSTHFAYFTFYSTYSVYILGEQLDGILRKLMRFFLFFMFPISFLTAMYSGSRQVLIIGFPFLLFLLYIRYKIFFKRNRLLTTIIFTTGLFFAINWAADLYEGSLLQTRNEISLEDDERPILLRESIQIGLSHPLFGVGPLNTQKFTSLRAMAHNSFAQIFSDTGFIGLFLFSYMIFYFIKMQWSRYKETNDSIFLSFFIFGIIWTFDQFFYVFYHSTWLISFFILVSVHSTSYYKEKFSC